MFDDLIDVEIIHNPLSHNVEFKLLIKFQILNPSNLKPSTNIAYRILNKKWEENKNSIIYNPENLNSSKNYLHVTMLQYLRSLIESGILFKTDKDDVFFIDKHWLFSEIIHPEEI